MLGSWNMKKLLGILVLGLLFSGNVNSAISIGSEKIVIITDQPGAHCVLTNNKGSWSVLTPGIVKVKRSKKQLNVICNKDGYKETVTNHKLRDSSAVDQDSVFGLAEAGGWLATGDVVMAGLEALESATDIFSSKFGTYANNFGNDKDKRQPTIFIKLDRK